MAKSVKRGVWSALWFPCCISFPWLNCLGSFLILAGFGVIEVQAAHVHKALDGKEVPERDPKELKQSWVLHVNLEDYRHESRHKGLLLGRQGRECHMFRLTESKRAQRHERPCEVHCKHCAGMWYKSQVQGPSLRYRARLNVQPVLWCDLVSCWPWAEAHASDTSLDLALRFHGFDLHTSSIHCFYIHPIALSTWVSQPSHHMPATWCDCQKDLITNLNQELFLEFKCVSFPT